MCWQLNKRCSSDKPQIEVYCPARGGATESSVSNKREPYMKGEGQCGLKRGSTNEAPNTKFPFFQISRDPKCVSLRKTQAKPYLLILCEYCGTDPCNCVASALSAMAFSLLQTACQKRWCYGRLHAYFSNMSEQINQPSGRHECHVSVKLLLLQNVARSHLAGKTIQPFELVNNYLLVQPKTQRTPRPDPQQPRD